MAPINSCGSFSAEVCTSVEIGEIDRLLAGSHRTILAAVVAILYKFNLKIEVKPI